MLLETLVLTHLLFGAEPVTIIRNITTITLLVLLLLLVGSVGHMHDRSGRYNTGEYLLPRQTEVLPVGHDGNYNS